MLAPVGGDGGIDVARHFVEDGLWISIGAHRAEHRLPDVVLASRATMVALSELHVIRIALSLEHLAQIVSERRALYGRGLASECVGVLVLIKVHHRVGPEIDRVGAS